MKTLARTGAIVSFTFFVLPGVSLTFGAGHEGGMIVLGMILIGIAFFVGPMLWLTGEKCCPKQDGQ